MDIDDDDVQNNLAIPIKPIVEELTCPICYSWIKDCSMTPCGHNFCDKCVRECINRNHKCPLCNAQATMDKLIKNHHLDKLIEIICHEKEEASKRYFNDLINNADIKNSQRQQQEQHKVNPIQELFSKYLRTSLLQYEEMNVQMENKLKENLEGLEREKVEIAKRYSGQPVLLEQASFELSFKRDKLVKSHQETIEQLYTAYEEHLKRTAVSPKFVNIQVNILLQEKSITFEHVSLSPSATTRDIKNIIIEKLDQKGPEYKLIKFADNTSLVVQRPLAMGGGSIELDNEVKPLSLYDIPQSSKIVLLGEVKLQMDMPKLCFNATNFKAGDQCDYWKCENCNYNWICKTCAEHCHRGHKLVPFMIAHKPTFACCYDTKHRDICKLLPKV
ncbi:hypothetical protein SAMD00019534_120460 [Acytostelium subglobosum LB1]|uniref:hypothetical protein n=1 Tax=Acytostelium subglobosum LB1 TaxID=1410327 RepID=UPI000644F217|nr:hypothetical protein SAMD00019534_120460 [Acytostelium subglobosum LB1]GAM28870.1 hypothetical protein SAMD00019534_120460 [Acytostelium subglobosum LB1]|eukprot:XP_012748242.1 hypothetical protein SAMD00019534_120460 [Acytostelium subglobosum LB1]